MALIAARTNAKYQHGIYQEPLSLISFDHYAVHVCDRAGLPIWFFVELLWLQIDIHMFSEHVSTNSRENPFTRTEAQKNRTIGPWAELQYISYSSVEN